MSNPYPPTNITQPTGPPPRLKDRYRLVEWLGEGGMGTVYRARDEMLGREVAIKFLSPRQLSNAEMTARFLREARIVAQLSHPNLMTLYDVDREGQWSYLVLEYIAGQNLHSLTTTQNTPLAVNEVLRIMRRVLAALAYAHTQGVIHRDLKPENIMVTPSGEVKVTDFGLSLARGVTRLTETDTIIGTVLYLAPEVVAGEQANQHSDLYAVGAVLYELLTSQPPFKHDHPMAIFGQILNAPLTPPRLLNPNIPVEVEQVVITLLAKDPQARYPSAEAVLAALPNSDQTLNPRPEPAVSPPPASSLLERLVRSSAAARRQVLEKEKVTDPDRPEALLLYAALEDTTAAVETERRRLAGLLQRQVAETLNLLLAQTNAYEQSLGANPTARMAVSVLGSLARQVSQQVRDLAANLHPATLENLGLEPALEILTSQVMRVYGLQINLTLERLPQRPPPQVELVIFRTVQTTLERAIQEGHASQVTLRLTVQAEHLVCYFADNGLTPSGESEIFQMTRRRIEQLGGTLTRDDSALILRFPFHEPVQLTPREMAVICLLAEGLTNKEIARRLSLKPRTVNFHLDNIYSKLGVNSRTEAAIYALRQGWTGQPG